MKMESKKAGIYLRFPTVRDAKGWTEAINFIEVARPTASIPHPYTMKDAKWFLSRRAQERRAKSDFVFGVFDSKTRKVIGCVGLHGIHLPGSGGVKDASGELGYWLTPSSWGKGIMPVAASMVLEWTFKKLDLHRIHANVFAENLRSTRVLLKLGFRIEGIRRESTLRYGKRCDDIIFGLLKKEFLSS